MTASDPLFTTEPMATRALGAEFRHAPGPALELLAERLGLSPRDFDGEVHVRCEAEHRIDVMLTVERARDKPVTIGIEAKFDHTITKLQLDKQADFNHHVLLVLETEDAAKFVEHVDAVVTWSDLLKRFTDSRLTLADLDGVKVGKVVVERLFNRLHDSTPWPDGWRTEVRRGGRGLPAIVIQSPPLPDGRELRGQLQVHGRKMPARREDVQIEYHVGIEVHETDQDFPALADGVRPGWVDHLRTLDERVIEGRERGLGLRTTRCARGGGELGQNKVPLAKKYLEDRTWLALGYMDWALGVKSKPTPITDLETAYQDARDLFLTWYDRSTFPSL